MKNSYAIAKDWMYKDEALWVQYKLDLDSNDELKSILFANMTHPSFEEVLDKINSRTTNPWEILDNKMVETIFLPIDIHEETPLELEKEDDIDDHISYFINISSNPCSHEKSLDLIGLSNIATHEIFNPLVLPAHKIFERVVVDAYIIINIVDLVV
jgi:hypothetical protein